MINAMSIKTYTYMRDIKIYIIIYHYISLSVYLTIPGLPAGRTRTPQRHGFNPLWNQTWQHSNVEQT